MPVDYVSSPFLPNTGDQLSHINEAGRLTVYMFANGLRALRFFTNEACDYFHSLASSRGQNVIFLVILMVSVMITLASVTLIFF